MSIIENINVGVEKLRDRNNLSQDTHTTLEVGYIQPTFCRTLVQKTHVKIDCKSLVRLSPLAVPTMGRISLRHYFSFVDFSTLWTPFEAMRTGNNYTYADGSVQVPFMVPKFSILDLFNFGLKPAKILAQDFIPRTFYCTLYKNGTVLTSVSPELTALIPTLGTSANPFTSFPCYYKQGSLNSRISTFTSTSIQLTSGVATSDSKYWVVVNNKNADFSYSVKLGSDTYMFLCKFTILGKRLRSHFIGLGYSFSPYSETKVTPLKLFAEYKAWFDKFAVQRTINFNNTACYQIMKYLSENPPISRQSPYLFNPSYYPDGYGDKFIEFLEDLADICYVLPPDYFSASDTQPNRGSVGGEAGGGMRLRSYNDMQLGNGQYISASGTPNGTPNVYLGNWGGNLPAQGIEMALQMLRFSNKRSVVGRKVSDLLALEGISDTHNDAHEQVHHLGSSRVDVQISDVISNADTSTASLGDYVGRGIGFKDSDTFVYDTPRQGVLICMSCIVPTSGYFQGMLKENCDAERFEFFTEEYDALGYQSLALNELVADNQFGSSIGNGNVGTEKGYLGLVPRYQHLRVGRNICNSDISLPSMQAVMLPYNLDRHFPTMVPKEGTSFDFESIAPPVVLPEVFRNVKADTGYGDYNRIFQYQSPDYDHFIVHIVFNVPIVSPMLSVGNAYDTFQVDDDKALEFKHE